MKKALNLMILCLLTIIVLQATAKNKSKLALKASIGLFPTYLKDKPVTLVPPLGIGLDYRIHEKISLEGFAGYSRSRISDSGPAVSGGNEPVMEWENSFAVMGLKTAFHTTAWEKWDAYGGMMINYNTTKIKTIRGNEKYMQENLGIKPSASKISFSGFVGVMFLPTEKIGLFSELGFGISLLSVGVSWRF